MRNPNQDPLRLLSGIYTQVQWALNKMPPEKKARIPQYLINFCGDFERGYNKTNPFNQPQMNADFYTERGFYGFPPNFTTSKNYYFANISQQRDPETIYNSLKETFIRNFVPRPPVVPRAPLGFGRGTQV